MQTFFNKVTSVNRQIQRNPAWTYASAGLQRNLKNIIQYYRIRPFAVKSNHLLAKIINTVSVSHSTNTERFYDIVDGKALNLGMTHKLTSSIHRGSIFDGVFYGPGTKEVIFAVSQYLDPYFIEKNWKNVCPVTVLNHPRSDLEMLLPNGKSHSVETGLACIAIDIPMLAMQFRAFAKEQMLKSEATGNNPLAVANFIHMYVLPNMLPSHLDVALFNRAVNFVNGAPMGEALKKHPFTVLDYTRQVDDTYKDLVKFVKQNDRDFTTILKSFPCVSVENFEALMRLPEQAPTRQVGWAEVVTRLKALDWLTTISPKHGLAHNASDINYLTKSFVAYASDGAFKQILDDDLYLDTIRTIKDIAARISPSRFHLE